MLAAIHQRSEPTRESEDAFEATERAEIYAQAVAMFLAVQMGEAAANARVLKRLSVVLKGMRAGARADNIAAAISAGD